MELGDLALQVVAQAALGLAYFNLGNYPRAIDFLTRNAESLTGDLIREGFGLAGIASVVSRTWLACCFAECGQFAEGTSRAEEGVRIAEEADHPFSLVSVYLGVGFLHVRKGDLQKAVPVLERALTLCRAWNLLIWLPLGASLLGSAYTLSGRVLEALPLLEQAVEQGASIGQLAFTSLSVGRLGEAYLAASRLDDARQTATRTLDLSRKCKERGHEAWALRLHGEIASHRDPPDVETGESHYRQAMALAEELGMRPLLAHCHLGLARLYQRTSDRAKGQEHLTTACGLYREMDMQFWLEQAEAEFKKLG